MRAVVQRVKNAQVVVDGRTTGKISHGLLIYLGIGKEDSQSDITYIRDKCVNLRIFHDENGQMNLSALDLGLEILLVSQFTLYGDCRKGAEDQASTTHALSSKPKKFLRNRSAFSRNQV